MRAVILIEDTEDGAINIQIATDEKERDFALDPQTPAEDLICVLADKMDDVLEDVSVRETLLV